MHSEAEFTSPRPDCPRPDYWSATDADSTEIEVTELVAAFVTALHPEFVVETGTAFGQTAEAMGRSLARNGHGRLVSLETDAERVQEAKERCQRYPMVEIRQQSSLVFMPDQPVDFAWFDSLLHLRCEEFLRYYDLMTQRTIVGFHDTGPQHPIRPDIEALAAEGLLRPIFLPTPRGVCFAQVLR